jgi:hypothetical protein
MLWLINCRYICEEMQEKRIEAERRSAAGADERTFVSAFMVKELQNGRKGAFLLFEGRD